MASKVIVGPGHIPPPTRPQVVPPQVQIAMQRMGQRNQQLEQECIRLQGRNQHLTGCLINIIRHHFNGKPIRFPFDLMNKIAPDTAINTEKDVMSDEIVIEELTAKEYQMRMRGLEEKLVEVTVPKKSPFEVVLEMPPRGVFEAVSSVKYRGGKLNGKELIFAGVRCKPKKPREFTLEPRKVDGSQEPTAVLRFTTDSAGMGLTVGFIVRMPAKEEPEEEVVTDQAPLTCDDDWHKSNDVVGLRCPRCGDSRKVEALCAEPS